VKKTYYEFLGVTKEASPEEIKAAAQYLAKKFHPSKYPGNHKVAAYFKKIKIVYNILANPQKRTAYDATLAKKRFEAESESPSQNPPKPKKTTKTQLASEKIVLWKDEKIIYSASLHWLDYIIALLIIGVPIYFLGFESSLLKTYLNQIDFSQDYSSYLKLGLQVILGLGILKLLRTLWQQFSTRLMITSHRIIAKFGLIFRKELGMTHAQFEHLEVEQSILGKIFGFGTIKIRGYKGTIGEINIHINNIAAPKIFEKRLIRILKQNGYHQL